MIVGHRDPVPCPIKVFFEISVSNDESRANGAIPFLDSSSEVGTSKTANATKLEFGPQVDFGVFILKRKGFLTFKDHATRRSVKEVTGMGA
jgi:hypothetical protein